jgi:hypothetical protein
MSMDNIKMDDKSTRRATRTPWERPVLRRLAANKAEGSGIQVDDGHCVGTGSQNHHVCLS